MGEIAEMMIDGDLCGGCGVYLPGEGQGFQRFCKSCKRERGAENHRQTLAQQQLVKKVPCPTCGRKVKAIGLDQHIRDSHMSGPIEPTDGGVAT